MTKEKVRKYNIIAFVVLPIVIVLLGILAFLFCYKVFTKPTVDFDEVTSKTQSGELHEELTVVESEYAYTIYCVDGAYYGFDSDKDYAGRQLIAFQGASVEEIDAAIAACQPGGYATSYWEGEGTSFDFTTTNDFEEYLEDIRNGSYHKTLDSEDVAADFSHVTLYDLTDYKGYEYTYNNGIALALGFFFFGIAGITLVVLLVELVIAIILKLIVFRVKKGQDA